MCFEMLSLITGSKFHSSGREDMDVRMLGCFASTGQLELFTPSDCIEKRLASLSSGLGRQFVIELVDPHCPYPSIETSCSAEAALPSLCQRLINENSNSTDRVCVHALTPCTRQFFEILKHGETHKVKEYQCVCWSSVPVTADILGQLQQRCHDLVITQKTPLRVSHRRTLMDRKRVIHDIQAVLLPSARLGGAASLQSHFFTLTLSTQAGTYIKEFVHGDKGRTRPSVADLLELNGSADILQVSFRVSSYVCLFDLMVCMGLFIVCTVGRGALVAAAQDGRGN
jgi:tRNA pseudouridine synthase 10